MLIVHWHLVLKLGCRESLPDLGVFCFSEVLDMHYHVDAEGKPESLEGVAERGKETNTTLFH